MHGVRTMHILFENHDMNPQNHKATSMNMQFHIGTVVFMFLMLIWVNLSFADPAHHDLSMPSAAAASASGNPNIPIKSEEILPKSDSERQVAAPNTALSSENTSLPKGFDASADRVWEEIQEQIPSLMESCGNAGLTSLGVDFYYDAKGNIFKVQFGYMVKDGVGSLSGSSENNTDDIVAVKQCVANKLSKVKFNIDVTNDIIELFSTKDKKVLSIPWYGEFSFGYRYDEHRLTTVTSYAIGRKDQSSKFWKCRKHGCNTPYLNRPFLSNNEIEIIKKDIIDLMGKLPVDSKTMMSPGLLGTTE